VLSLLTKAIIQSINREGNRCVVRIPLFETASSTTPIEIEALINITPGLFNNLFVGDVVFVGFEENAMEKPVVLGKLYTGASKENLTSGGGAIISDLRVSSSATLPAATRFEFPEATRNEYQDLKTPKKIADYIKWLETTTKNLIRQSDEHFRCFKNWTQWQLRPENVEIDDGDLDTGYNISESFQYQNENAACYICEQNCPKNKNRQYLKLDFDKVYPNT
jgi:hypothetical protein